MECIFCKIASKEIPADIVFETENTIAFRDLNPQAPTHVLVIPKRHIEGIGSANDQDPLHELLAAAVRVAEAERIQQAGYRLVINQGMHGGQTVHHLHVHVLGGRVMTWPPG